MERLQLTLQASSLKNVAGLGKGKSDPFAIVTLLATGPGEQPRVLGKTEGEQYLSNPWHQMARYLQHAHKFAIVHMI